MDNLIFNDIIINKYTKIMGDMMLKYRGQAPCTLTDSEEIIAVGVLAGGEMNFQYDVEKGVLSMSTKGVAGAAWDGKEFRYFQNLHAN